MSRPLVWITGAGGLIGHAFTKTASVCAPEWDTRPLTRGELDLSDFAAVRQAFTERPPQAVIHCAAMSKTPACQANPLLARRLNVEVTALLAELAVDIPFVFFSSDLVFDGRSGPYDERSPVNPINVYAETKAAAEPVVLCNPRHTVIRTSLNGGASPTGDRGFNEEMRRAWAAGRTLSLFHDEFRCPLAAVVTARAVWTLLAQDRPGLYHVAGSERLSRWQIGQIVAGRCPELQPRLEAGSLQDYSGLPRSPDIMLRCDKVQALLPFRLPRLTEWLRENPAEPF